MLKPYEIFYIFGIVACLLVFLSGTAFAFFQPTRPCISSYCPDPPQNNPDPEDKEKLKCNEISKKYFPKPGGNIFNEEFKESYVLSCFKKLNELPETTSKVIRAHVVRLKKQNEDVGFCNAGLINNQTLITARHCLVPEENWRKKIDSSFLDEVEVVGIDENGKDWIRLGLKILEDPIKNNSSNIASDRMNDLDFMILQTTDSRAFPIASTVELVRSPNREPVAAKERLVFASYLDGKRELLTDYLISCNVFLVNKGYFNHNCQSHTRSSGAPVWLFSEDYKLKQIVGVHVGGAGWVNDLNRKNIGTNEAIAVPPLE